MAQFWTEDPTIGNALAGLADSFSGKNAVAMANSIEDIKKKRAQAAAAAEADAANRAMWMNRPLPEVAPQTPNQEAWATGRGTENVPALGPAPLQAYTPDIAAADTAATAAAQRKLNAETTRVRAKQLADSSLGYQHATSMGDVATNAPKMEANTQLDIYGVPRSYQDQIKMQTQLTGKLPMLDVTGSTSNYAIQDPQGNIVGKGTTRDGRTDLTTGQPIQAPAGHSVVKMGELSADQSPFKDQGAQLAALNNLTAKVTIGQQPLTAEEKQRANILVSTLFPNVQKVEKDDAGNLRVVGYNEKVVPPVYGPLLAHLQQGMGPTAPAAPGTPPAIAAPAAPQTGTPPVDPLAAIQPGVTTGPQQQPDQKPILPPGVTVSPPVVQGSGDPQLKEVLNHPTVKGAMDAGRAYNELLAASQAKTPEADLHMIYMLAKIYDPNSVVREGEVATAANTSPAMEKWWGLYNKQMQAGSALSDRARASFIDEGYKAATAHYNTAADLIKFAGERAGKLGLDPSGVMPPLSAPQRPGGVPAATPAARTGGGVPVMLDGKRYTKNPDGSFSGPN